MEYIGVKSPTDPNLWILTSNGTSKDRYLDV